MPRKGASSRRGYPNRFRDLVWYSKWSPANAASGEGWEAVAPPEWQAGGGLALALSRPLSLTLDYRHCQLTGVTFDHGGESIRVGKVKTNLFTAGLRYLF